MHAVHRLQVSRLGILSDVGLDFLVGTYEETSSKFVNRQARDASSDDVDDLGERRRGPGRPSNPRAHYVSPHPKAGSQVRVKRAASHRNPFYCASMLALLKPWRDLAVDQ